MKPSMSFAAFCLLCFTSVAGAYEYPLQFTPNPGFKGLIVAGYEIDTSGVTGNCSYYTVLASSGRGGHSTTTQYAQTCKWDLYGNLLSITPGAPAVPAPLYTNGTETVFAASATGGYSGTDSKLPNGGFVNTRGSHYSWIPSDAQNTVMPLQGPLDTFVIKLKSDGDFPLHVSLEEAKAVIGNAGVRRSTCTGVVPVGATCSITLTYGAPNISTLTGIAADSVTVSVTSDAGQANDFVGIYTVPVSVLKSES